MKFYRDGNLVGDPLPLHRDITDCWNPDKVKPCSALTELAVSCCVAAQRMCDWMPVALG